MSTNRAPVSKWIQLARDRDQRDQENGKDRGLWFDQSAVDRVDQFFGLLEHYKGEWAGQSFKLAPWQIKDIIRPLFGWKRADGTRRFRIAYIEIPRKNGKSTMAAGIGLYLLVADGEPGAEVYSTATKRDQAKIVWGDADAMVKTSKGLSRYIKSSRNNLSVRETMSKFEPLGADSNTLDGLNPHGNITDELHAHRDRLVWDVMGTAVGSRRQPLTVAITTAGVYRPESIGWEQHQHAIQVLEGALEDDAFFAYIAAAHPDDDWTDPNVWAAANPNLGISLKPDYLADKCLEAQQSANYLNTFLRLHLNIWTQQVTRWLKMEDWHQGNLDTSDLTGQVAYGGLDLASTTDITALVLVLPDTQGWYDVVCRFWIPEDTMIERSRRDLVPYDAWVRDGWMIATPGNVTDYNRIRVDVQQLAEQYQIEEIGYDPWNAAQITTQMQEDGIEMVPVRQGFASLSNPSKELERLVLSHKIAHGGHPVLRWMASNVATETDAAGNIKPSKAKSTEKIDGIVALVMAIDRATRATGDDDVWVPTPLVVIEGGLSENRTT